MKQKEIITRVIHDLQEIDPQAWDDLLAQQPLPTPFMRHAYLAALQQSGSASVETGWDARFLTLWDGTELAAACPLYLKSHSWGEYVFDFAWAQAYRQHGLAYYPKALIAVPFTPVPGTRLLARDAGLRQVLAQALGDWCATAGLSSAHVLFAEPQDQQALLAAGWQQRDGLQFHWTNRSASGQPWTDFEDFLAGLQAVKRKKIRQERRKVAEAGVLWRCLEGRAISAEDWEFFTACYQRTYLEHRNAPYLSADFFQRMHREMPEHWVMFVAERQGRPIASSLIAVDIGVDQLGQQRPATAYGRYWGALERVDCLHFEACYYQPLEWCLRRAVQRFEGGAQGEHKMARALLPAPTRSLHWIAHEGFAEAIGRFLQAEREHLQAYGTELMEHQPLKHGGAAL